MASRREWLEKLLKASALFGALCILIVLFDFSFDRFTPSRSYRFEMPDLAPGQAALLNADQMLLAVARQGVNGNASDRLFVALGYGSLMQCPLTISEGGFRESCSEARYDFQGLSSDPGRYSDLEEISYRMSRDNKYLIVD